MDANLIDRDDAIAAIKTAGADQNDVVTNVFVQALHDLEPAEPSCPECDGEGTVHVMSDGGPDAYEVPVDCPHCGGGLTLARAYAGVCELLKIEERKNRHTYAIVWRNGRGDGSALTRLHEMAEHLEKTPQHAGWVAERLRELHNTLLMDSQAQELPAPAFKLRYRPDLWLHTAAIQGPLKELTDLNAFSEEQMRGAMVNTRADEQVAEKLVDDITAWLREQGPVGAMPYHMLLARAKAALTGKHFGSKPPEGEHHGLDTAERVCFYEQDFYVLSNFSSFNLEWEGITFPTSEHAYHWEKFANEGGVNTGNEIAHWIMEAPSAHEAFKLAEINKPFRRGDWDLVKVPTMHNILRAKAKQHEYVRRKLLATGNRLLVENSWRDDFWGWGPNRDGQNMLGQLWMKVRDELREQEGNANG